MKFRSPSKNTVVQFLVGMATAVMLAQGGVTWQLVCGVSTASVLTLLFMIASGIFLCSWWAHSFGSSRAALLLAVICGVVSAGLPFALDHLLSAAVSVLTFQSGAVFVIPGSLILLQVFTAGLWLRTMSTSPSGGAERSMLAGLACGLIIPVMHGLVTIPMAVTVISTVTVATLAGWWLRSDSETSNSQTTQSVRSGPAPSTSVLLAVGIGLAWVCSVLHVRLMMPVHPALLLTAAAILICMMMSLKLGGAGRKSRAATLLGAFLVWAGWPVFGDRLIELNLNLNAEIRNSWLLHLLRSLQLALFWLPPALIGMVFRSWQVSSSNASARDPQQGGISARAAFNSESWTMVLILLLSGIGCGLLLTTLGVDVRILRLLSVLVLCLPLLQRSAMTGPLAVSRLSMSIAGILAMLLTLIPFDGVKCSSLLFNSQAAAARRQGMETDLILQSQGIRLIEHATGDGQLLTVWKTSGDRYLIRRGGLPSGELSANTMTTPQPIAEVLTTLLPLTIHRHAQSVLLLGDDSGVGLRLCCDFPLHTINAVRSDSLTTKIARRSVWNSMETSPEEDDRVTLNTGPPCLAVREPTATGFDVIVAALGNPLDLQVQSLLTSEFYRHAALRLTRDGVFCQRIHQHDLGAADLLQIVATVRSQFAQVIALQMSPGEIAILAGNGTNPLLDEGLLERISRDHVVRQLSLSGWDWSQVAALPVINTNDPVGIFEHEAEPAALTVASGHQALHLPFEANRWADKAGELQQTFAPHQVRLADAGPRSTEYAEFSRRFSSVVQQSEIVSAFPDNPWPYRKSLKMEMQRNPRPPMEVVKNGSVVQQADPEDELRRDYFESLGQLLNQATTGTVDSLLLRDFSRFTNRYEPLLTYFAHHELVRVHAATGHPSPALELRNRLHTVYFSEPGDLSVRTVSQAMEQILEDPELLTDVGQKYDYLNSMLQELVRRWEGRRGYSPGSAAVTQQDVDDCVRVANRALEVMQQMGRSVGVTDHDLLARRRFLTRTLITPLRDYREQVLVHRARQHAEEDPAPESTDDGTGLPLLLEQSPMVTN
ncbi:MAG: hypothetical protein R3C49_05375 [Planctomycetaceae bacterium]